MVPVTDFHTHAFPDKLAPRTIERLGAEHAGGVALDGTVGGLLESMDRAGIGRSVICSIATAPKQVRSILEWSLSIRSPRIEPFASVHPDCEDPAGEVARIAESAILGIKLHAQFQDCALDDRRWQPVYRAVADQGLILVLHCGLDVTFPPDDERSHPEKVLALHRRFPEIPIVATHMGGWRRWEAALESLAGTDVYLETSYSLGLAPPEALGRIIERHSPRRILFGSDSPWRDQAADLEWARRLWPDPARQRQVLAGNAERLLNAARR